LSDYEIKEDIRKQTKTERIINILLLFFAVFFSGALILLYLLPDPNYLEFARSAGWQITGYLGAAIGILLVRIISGKKRVIKSKNTVLVSSLLFFLFFLILCVVFVVLMVVFRDSLHIWSGTDPNDYLRMLLSFSGLMVVFGVLISLIWLYIDDFVEKYFKGTKF